MSEWTPQRRKLSDREKSALAFARKRRQFPAYTCPASRHVHLAAEELMRHGHYSMCQDEPEHIGESMLVVVGLLWEARARLAQIAAEYAPEAERQAREEKRREAALKRALATKEGTAP